MTRSQATEFFDGVTEKAAAAAASAVESGGALGEMSQELAKEVALENEVAQKYYGYAAVACLVLSVIGLVMLCGMAKKIKITIAILDATSKAVLAQPSLLLVPLMQFALQTGAVLGAMWGLALLLTVEPSGVEAFRERVQQDVSQAQSLGQMDGDDMLWWLKVIYVCCVLWVIHFVHAVFCGAVSSAISHWYFYRHDPTRGTATAGQPGYFFGRPLLEALWRVIGHHMGSMAFGSFILTLAKLLKWAMMYMLEQSKEWTEAESNCVVRVLIRCLQCCVNCVDRFLQYMTDLALAYVGIFGETFCQSAAHACQLVLQWPVQLAVNEAAVGCLRMLTCLTIPLACVVSHILYSMVFMGTGRVPTAVLACTLLFSYAVASGTVALYDCAVDAVFICLCRDRAKFDSQHMTQGLREAFGVGGEEEQKHVAKQVEMTAPRGGHAPLIE